MVIQFSYIKKSITLDPNNDQLNMVSIKGEVKNPALIHWLLGKIIGFNQKSWRIQ